MGQGADALRSSGAGLADPNAEFTPNQLPDLSFKQNLPTKGASAEIAKLSGRLVNTKESTGIEQQPDGTYKTVKKTNTTESKGELRGGGSDLEARVKALLVEAAKLGPEAKVRDSTDRNAPAGSLEIVYKGEIYRMQAVATR